MRNVLPQRLRQSRKSKGYTQDDLAKIVKTKKTTISNYETGYSSPSNEMLIDLADVLDTNTDYLLGRTEDPAPTRPLDVEASTTYNIAGKDINLTEEELDVLTEMKKHPKFAAMFHDLATNPEKKVKTLIKMWEVIKADLDEDDERDDIIDD